MQYHFLVFKCHDPGFSTLFFFLVIIVWSTHYCTFLNLNLNAGAIQQTCQKTLPEIKGFLSQIGWSTCVWKFEINTASDSKIHQNITSCKMANDILRGIINPKYQAETMLVFVLILQGNLFHNCNLYMQGFKFGWNTTGLSINISEISQPLL